MQQAKGFWNYGELDLPDFIFKPDEKLQLLHPQIYCDREQILTQFREYGEFRIPNNVMPKKVDFKDLIPKYDSVGKHMFVSLDPNSTNSRCHFWVLIYDGHSIKMHNGGRPGTLFS